MYKDVHKTRTLLIGLGVLLIASCGGSGNKSTGPSYLNVSVDEFYFGTRDVGSKATQTIELTNQSADVYPINSLHILGENSDEFSTSFTGGITLNPAERISIDVTFSPISSGLKAAQLDIDYDVISRATAEQNQSEQAYYRARSLEKQERYGESLETYLAYVNSDPVTTNKQRAEIKLPVLTESERYGNGEDFRLYLKALNLREEGQFNQAVAALSHLTDRYSDSFLADDALYLQGYIRMVDQQDNKDGQQYMAALQHEHPDSSYIDTAVYSEAIALEQMGELDAATEKFETLLKRHRSENWAKFNVVVAQDSILSRMWFERASDALDRISQMV